MRLAGAQSGTPSQAAAHATAFRLREQRKGRQDPFYGLAWTSRFTAADNPLDTDALFPGRDRAITVAFDLIRTGVAAGVVFELGTTGAGLAAWVDGNDLGIAAGSFTVADDGVDEVYTEALPVTGQRFRFVFATNPRTGEVRLWRDGILQVRAAAVSGDFSNVWSADAFGAVGALSGLATDRIPAPSKVPLANCDLVGSLRFAYRQLPRQFD